MRRSKTTAGFALMEMIVALAIVAIALAFFSTLISNSAERDRESLSATHAKRMVEAAQNYINDNAAYYIAHATATTPVNLPTTTVQNAGYLPDNFSLINPYNQTYAIRILQPTAGELSALMITYGGQTMGEGTLRRIARQIGPEGGYFSTDAPATATGAYEAWTTAASTYNYVQPSYAGHLAVALFFRDSQQVSDFIYRGAVAGRPELNQMTTSLDLGNNNLSNAANVTASGTVQGQNVTAVGRVHANYYEIAGAVTTGNTCTPNGLLGREADGRLASCVSGVWRRAGY